MNAKKRRLLIPRRVENTLQPFCFINWTAQPGSVADCSPSALTYALSSGETRRVEARPDGGTTAALVLESTGRRAIGNFAGGNRRVVLRIYRLVGGSTSR